MNNPSTAMSTKVVISALRSSGTVYSARETKSLRRSVRRRSMSSSFSSSAIARLRAPGCPRSGHDRRLARLGAQRLVQVRPQIRHVLDADGQTDEAIVDAGGVTLLAGERRV